ncbi:hypothetical protein E4U22_005922 [Claviceps purpurea]|uniref:Hydrophobin 3 n=1 Tax=Claviceps purpurea (strain 20.1) TaxID=1111077 RepID=M1W6H5_CLAP2|nr:hypothetical protein E4U28_004549 [Claviceps purpurea]CCE34646.1 uncharacterized protein CPUR_08580 [Claviceps purpurea 20.1]KAG6152867.1 hypothetical protein E4U37_003448 [Claviceps purpurea]KAG6160322.1 hypothetical protein E4U11_003999 [Claviceps purpurea]KAG6172529.1 hypothetical protein E4U27_006980 [Claviceps purpurea]
MKYTAAIVALAATVIAIPTGGGGDSSGSCNNDHPNYVCCQGGLLGGILCNLNLLGTNCGGGSYCCKSAPQTGLINIGLECIKLL